MKKIQIFRETGSYEIGTKQEIERMEERRRGEKGSERHLGAKEMRKEERNSERHVWNMIYIW